MTLDTYIYEIRELLPDNHRHIDNRLIKRWIDSTRNIWIKNEFNKSGIISDSFRQAIYVELEPADQSTISNIPTKYRILKSTSEVPKMLFFGKEDGVISVRNARVISERYNYVTREQAVYAGSGKLNTKSIFTFIHDDYLYIKLLRDNPRIQMLDHAVIDCYIENPEEAANYTNDNTGEACFNILKQDYPISDTLWAYMKQDILNNGNLTIQSSKIEETDNEI